MPIPKQTVTRTIVFEDCFTCGIPIAMTGGQLRRFNEDGMRIICVLGHATGRMKSDLMLAREELAQVQDELAESETALKNEKALHDATIKAKRKLQKRVENGVCPFCKRTFQNLQRHMTGKHSQDGH